MRTKPAGTLVLSPHSDDAALSVGCMLQYGSAPPPITIATIFSKSDFAPLAGATDARTVTTIRSNEDRRFARLLNCQLAELGFHDATVRLDEPDTRKLLDPSLPVSLKTVAQLAADLSQIIDARRPALLLSPLGIGGHIDHRTVRDAACALSASTVKMLFYEDQPYTALGAVADIAWLAARQQPETVLDLCISGSEHLRRTKEEHAEIYASQPAALNTIALMREKKTVFHERLISCQPA